LDFKGKKILAVDFGLARVGVAVTDELHISIAPKETLLYQKPDFWKRLIALLMSERIGGIVVGTPYFDDEEHDMRRPIEGFVAMLKEQLALSNLSIPITFQDESYSSVYAANVMIEIGKKKKKRTTKGIKDGVAAAIILQGYLDSLC
jgi:putative Holliday junction resolvase